MRRYDSFYVCLTCSWLTQAVHSVAVMASPVSSKQHISQTGRMRRRCARRLHTTTDELFGFINIHKF